MAFFGLMTVKAHEELLDDLQADRDAIHKSYGVKHDALLEARQELSFQKGQVANLSERKDQETVRADLAEQRINRLLDEIESLRPDAEKHRERLCRDREYVAAKRARNVEMV